MFTNITVEKLVPKNHAYRKIVNLLDLSKFSLEFEKLYSKTGKHGIPIEKGLRMLILQFMEDLSDRQMEAAMQENIAFKYFCKYELLDQTPDHSYFGKLRKRLGTENVAKIFDNIVVQLKTKGISGNVFTFIDSTAIISKTALWSERDKAIKDGLDKLNNKDINKYSSDKQAKFGCKGKNKYWFGYKRHCAVDMKSGIITKVAVTPANVPDGKALKHVCPKNGGMIFADKAYSIKASVNAIRKNACYEGGVILKNNMKNKNKDKDSWLTKVRMPYEGVFSKAPRRARYRGVAKVQMQAFMEAIAYNIKRWLKINDLLENRCLAT